MVLSNPMVPFVVGLLAVVLLLVWLKLPAFVGLIIATVIVGVVTPEVPFAEVPTTTAEAFGDVLVGIGIPILMAAVIGKTLMESGAAERIVRAFLGITGNENSEYALLGSSYILSIPVFFDNVFYLLAPIGRSMRARTGDKFAVYISVLSAGALGTHMLVPPTPGPLAMAAELNVDLGVAMGVGALVAIPTTLVGGVVYGRWIDPRMDIPLRDAMGTTAESVRENADQPIDELPGIVEATLPIVVPVVFIASNTIAGVLLSEGASILSVTAFFGDPNIALTAAALLSSWTFYRMKDLTRRELESELTEALKSGGNIIAITAAGGAFGAMLQSAGIGDYIAGNLSEVGIPLLMTGWLIAGLIRIAQGSGTVAILTGASIMAPLTGPLSVHPVYMMMAVGTGGMLFAWYNDSGWWIVKEVAGITQAETFKTFSAVNLVMSVTGITVVLVLSTLMPLQ
ncbi:gluconate:H+ symporter, GntP family [Halopelagius inordinatus]|uniref:Gluconate:H+ symporter, GntP family n=1 Tax=Halopelagius inordinatus TaxID=553467 RepID=A0A1I2SSN0_9EURY|nr:gluconate transporter [Halopelagius inordinatus]SFG55712.1 gluconate:H+ symporter, GntP family [Halopelagius inordinatus]